MLFEKKVKMVGECGIDSIKTKIDINLQTQVFERQICLAEKYQIPLLVHCVGEMNALISLRKKHNTNFWIYHGFHGSEVEAKKLLEMNIYTSFGSALLNKKNMKITKSLAFSFAHENLLLETDNDETHSCEISEIYTEAARRLGVDVIKVIEIVLKSLKRLNVL
ncbi:hypothetical protein EIN_273450 [Entamoeba invadens IP1]|uniref:Uncharacterized protein n=1 Tax=Entamoeba invadens IP1 TaxID=370355 RepID=A0A0A1U4L3_ENTIV|nr:hypothetical protein EIN_273450 [Entamoeba invadens IP1]ELP87818.1 hypothetical protein EIN_273450 [Entamoeba invadens IP1]|eukprot:XP_004254589.1 hypothetical protein EIN_273450 [Entamoeba invadens IP1]